MVTYPEWENGMLPIWEVPPGHEAFIIDENEDVKKFGGESHIVAPVIEFRHVETLNERPPQLSAAIGMMLWGRWEDGCIKKLEDAGANEVIVLRRIAPTFAYETLDHFKTFQESIYGNEGIVLMAESETFGQACFFGWKSV